MDSIQVACFLGEELELRHLAANGINYLLDQIGKTRFYDLICETLRQGHHNIDIFITVPTQLLHIMLDLKFVLHK
jgi:hypothetical protein